LKKTAKDSLFFKEYNLIESVKKILIVNMIKKICLFVLVGIVSVVQAQKSLVARISSAGKFFVGNE